MVMVLYLLFKIEVVIVIKVVDGIMLVIIKIIFKVNLIIMFVGVLYKF